METKGFSFERLAVWQDAMTLSAEIYRITKQFPQDETYGVISQLRRAAVSIPVNIAEGRGRFHQKEQIQFFYHARGSLYEVVTLLKLALRFQYLNRQAYFQTELQCYQVLSKLSGLIRSLKL